MDAAIQLVACAAHRGLPADVVFAPAAKFGDLLFLRIAAGAVVARSVIPAFAPQGLQWVTFSRIAVAATVPFCTEQASQLELGLHIRWHDEIRRSGLKLSQVQRHNTVP